jgi:hypothetical protein
MSCRRVQLVDRFERGVHRRVEAEGGDCTTHIITALSPGASPLPVDNAILMISGILFQ